MKYIIDHAFYGCTTLKSVTFEGDVAICGGAFADCYNLQSVHIKGSLRAGEDYFDEDTATVGIGYAAFMNCYSLKTVKIDKDEYECGIDKRAFLNCRSLTSINIPGKCKNIDSEAFINCISLETMTIPPTTKLCDLSVGYCDVSEKSDDYPEPYVPDKKIKGVIFDIQRECYVDVTVNPITVYVTKDSPAETYCKENGVKYAYGSTATSASTNTATPSTAALTGVPNGFKATAGQKSITITWDKTDGADMYMVEMFNEETRKYEKYKYTKDEKCKITELVRNTKYKFRVTALSKNADNGKYYIGQTSGAFSITTLK